MNPDDAVWLAARFEAAVTRTAERRAKRARQREALKAARAIGLSKRHAERAARLALQRQERGEST